MQEQKLLLLELLIDFYQGNIQSSTLERKVAFIIAFMEGAFSLSVSANEIMPDDWAAQEVLDYLGIK